jgi:hypothetical protein
MKQSILFGDPNGPVIKVEVDIRQKLLQNLPITCMIGQVFIELRGYLSYLLQIPPRAVREVMVLDMITQH